MSTRIDVAHIVCDRCGAQSDPGAGVGPARVQARAIGWQVSGGGLADLCPNCRHEIESAANGSTS